MLSVADVTEQLHRLSTPANKYIAVAMKTAGVNTDRRRGRPLSFDREAALEQAMQLFWRHGFEATSVAELTTAMGITPPSLYAAFGDKKALFREAVARYLAVPATGIYPPATAREAARDLLRAAAVRFTGEDTPAGCLIASAAASCSPAAADIQAELAAVRRRTETWLRERAIQDGIDPGRAEALAAHVLAIVQGLSTLARDGADRDKLLRVVEIAMRAWPAPGIAGASAPS